MNDQVKAVLWEDIFAGDGEMEALMRRLKALRDLALQTSGAKTELEACRIAADILSAHPGDVSFVLLYLLDRTQTEQAQLLGTVGCEPGTLASPLMVDTASPGIWPFDTVLKTGQAVVATDLSHRMSCPSPVPWSEPPHTALVLPITPPGQSQPAGFLVAGISSLLTLDNEYRTFLELVAGQIATAVAKARAEEERTRADSLAELDRAKTAFFSPVSHEFRTPITLNSKLAEDALADTEQPLSPQQRERINEAARAQVIDVLESITDGFFSLDSRWRLTYVNQATERLSGKTRRELLGRSIWEVYPGLIGSRFDEQIRRAVREQVAVHFETPSVHAGIWREVHAYPHQNGLSIYWRDITNRKQAEEALRRREEELRLLADAIPALISYVDRDRCFRFVNRAYTDWFGHPAEEIIGQTVEEFVGETAYQHMRPHVEAALAGETVTVEMWIPFQDGGPRYVRRQYIPDLNERGEVKGFYALINDLTTLKQADAERERLLQELQTERARFEAVLQQMPAGVMIADAASGKLILTNEQAKQMIGYAYEQFLVIEEYEPIVPFEGFRLDGQRYAPEEYPLVRSLRTGEVVTHEEMKLHRGDGSRIFMSVNSAPILDNQEQISAAVVVFQDVTDRKQAEEALRQSEERFQLIAQATNDVMWDYNVVTNQMWWSDRVQQLFGYQPEELGLDMQGWAEHVHPDDLERVHTHYETCLSSGKSLWTDEYRFRRADSSYAYVLDRAYIIRDASGNPVRIVGAMTDISDAYRQATQRKQTEENLRLSENRYRTLANAVSQLMWINDVNGNIELFNQRWQEYTGVEDLQLGVGLWRDIIHPDDFQSTLETRTRAIQAGKAYELECRLKRFDQTYRWHLARIVPLKDKEGKVLQWFGTATDIHGVKQAEREREQLLAREPVAREEAEAANRIKDEFLAVLSHELRSPLNPILGWAKLLRSRRLDEQATTRALETIERNAKLQAQLIEDLLDVSRILRGKLVLNVAPVNLVTTIEAALETMRLAAEAKGIQIQTLLAPNVGRVKGDSARLQQVVWNLLSNAIKFTPTGGRVEVRLKQVDKYAQIQVKDKGKGITPEFLPHVFEYFRQADGTTTRQFGGLGLGLAIVRHLVELHGGSVQAESPGEGLGATFTVKLPLIENVPENNPHDRQDAATDLSGVRVLVVDDEADMRELVAFILEESGAEVQVAASATEALEKLEQFQQDILISDIGMPHVDGYMLMQQVRERFAQQGRQSPALSQAMPKAIALTAYAGEFNQQQALAAGFERHLSKPVEPNELVRAIATLVNR